MFFLGLWKGWGSKRSDFHCFQKVWGAFRVFVVSNIFSEVLEAEEAKISIFHCFFIVFETRDVLFPPGDEKFSRWINSAAPSRSLKTQARFFDYTFLFKLFFKSCDFGPSWGVAHGGDFLWWKIFADWKINYLFHCGVMSEFDISWRGLRNGDIDFPFVFEGFWGAGGVEILIFHGLEGCCGMEMLIFHCRMDGWRYRFLISF